MPKFEILEHFIEVLLLEVHHRMIWEEKQKYESTYLWISITTYTNMSHILRTSDITFHVVLGYLLLPTARELGGFMSMVTCSFNLLGLPSCRGTFFLRHFLT